MTGNRNRDLVGRTCSCDGANGFRCANPLSYLRIAGGLTSGNFPQRLPDTLLKHRAAQIEWEFEANLGMFDKADDIRDDCFEVTVSAEQIRSWKSVLEIVCLVGPFSCDLNLTERDVCGRAAGWPLHKVA